MLDESSGLMSLTIATGASITVASNFDLDMIDVSEVAQMSQDESIHSVSQC